MKKVELEVLIISLRQYVFQAHFKVRENVAKKLLKIFENELKKRGGVDNSDY